MPAYLPHGRLATSTDKPILAGANRQLCRWTRKRSTQQRQISVVYVTDCQYTVHVFTIGIDSTSRFRYTVRPIAKVYGVSVVTFTVIVRGCGVWTAERGVECHTLLRVPEDTIFGYGSCSKVRFCQRSAVRTRKDVRVWVCSVRLQRQTLSSSALNAFVSSAKHSAKRFLIQC